MLRSMVMRCLSLLTDFGRYGLNSLLLAINEQIAFSFKYLLLKGPSNNYVTCRGGKGANDFVTYRYVYFEAEGVFRETAT